MTYNSKDIFSILSEYSGKPTLFEPGEPLFWDDPHISRGMLEAHLNPDNDLASRRHETIDKEVEHLVSSGILKPGNRVLDLGCGPGLYTSRLARKGLNMTGIDISERSLTYAIAQSRNTGLDIDYRLLNFFDIDYSEEFDAVIQTNGELNVFSDDKLNTLLSKLHQALKPDGLLIFDVTTRQLRSKAGLKNRWYFSDGGFWRPGRHLVLEQGFDYPENDCWLDQNIVIDDNGTMVYRNWFHDYDLDSLRSTIQAPGFRIVFAWNDLTGTPYREGGDWLAIAAVKSSI